MSPPTAAYSVIIPAHNEEAVLRRCIDALLADALPGHVEIVVAANGCTDRTVEIARAYGPPVTVVEIEQSSKPAALNAADAVAVAFPRVYMDADIELSAASIDAVTALMALTGVPVGAPAPFLDLRRCTRAVRSYYRVWSRLPWFTDNPVGGVYVLSEAGHRRLGGFPDVTNDDQFVHDTFRADERICVRSHGFVIRPPRTIRAVVRCRVRTLAGQRELRDRFGPLDGTAPRASVVDLLRRHPALVVDLPVFAAVTRLASRAERKSAGGAIAWGRDDSTRVAGETA